MKKTIIFALALALLGGAAYANFGARDTVPAATLLVPYIVVDANVAGVPDVSGYTTLTVVTNVSSTKQLIHVTVYNAESVGVVDFDEVLTGYDVWTINWRDLVTGDFELFDTGVFPGGFWTGTVGTVGSPFGPTTNVGASIPPIPPNNPQDSDYPVPTSTGCGFPWGNLTAYSNIIVTKLQAPLISWPTQDTDCDPATTKDQIPSPAFLTNLGVSPLFFYATIDSVKACNSLFPDVDPSYWDTALPDYNGFSYPGYNSRSNVLTGYDFYLNNTLNYSESLPTVNIEASAEFVSTSNFYYTKRFSAGAASLLDDREPLPTAWAFNYFNGGGITTEVAVWKNVHELDDVDNLILACRPYIYYAWDEDEKSKARTTTQCPSGLCFGNPEPNVFPFETQKVAVTTTNFTGLMSGNGWMMLIFDPSIPYYPAGLIPDASIQSYVFAKYNWGTYSTSVEATSLGTPLWNGNEVLPVLNTYDGSVVIME
jgi:hypothetical protein